MNTGLTIKKIKTEIQSIFIKQPDIFGVYGFGSFFRSQEYKDIDLLLVSKNNSLSPLNTYYCAKPKLDELSKKIGVEIDITFLTYSEYLGKPLLEMDNLVTIYKNKT